MEISHLEGLQEVETDGSMVEPAVVESLDYEPDHESIARLAYALWQERGGVGASAEEDWFRAEQLLTMAEARRE